MNIYLYQHWCHQAIKSVLKNHPAMKLMMLRTNMSKIILMSHIILQRKRCHNQVEGYGDQFEKMQIWIQIRDSVGFMFRAGENPVEVKHIRN